MICVRNHDYKRILARQGSHSKSCVFNSLLTIDPNIFTCDIDIQESYEEIICRCCRSTQGEPEIKKEGETGIGPKQKRVHWGEAISRVNEEKFGEEDDDTDDEWGDLEKCGEEKIDTILDTIFDKLEDSWFSGETQDEDDLGGITNYLEPTSYDGFIDSSFSKEDEFEVISTHNHVVKILLQHRFIIDDPNITMEEYIRLEVEKAQRQGRTFDWKTARYGKTEYYENEDDSFTNLKTEYPAIFFDDISDAALSCKPTVSPLDNNEIDFNISFDESDDDDYKIVFEENSFSCKIISVDNLKTDSENENDKINIPSSSSPEPTIGYFDDLDFLKDFENEFPSIVYNDLKSKSDLLNELSEPYGAIRKSTIWYTLKKTCVELVRAF
ncbi:hypothetical protein Tco_0194957 [Tanacetum coccineum]